MNPLKDLNLLGQSVWLDALDSRLIDGGELRRLVEEDALGGVTSNPTIFQKAIESGSEERLLAAVLAERPWADETAAFEAVAVRDVRGACDILLGLYEKTLGADGYVSLEVSPRLAHDTEGTVREARRLWEAVAKPNLMIKVPGTRQGVPAIEELTAGGVSVNVTLLFSLAQYEAIAGAYIRGLSRADRPERVASVASFFVSRVDTLVDRNLDSIGTPEALALRGKIAVANAKVVYKRFQELFLGEAFAGPRKRGARAQRPLWASTGTKNPAYSDILYVQELIAPQTVTTLPPSTMAAFRDHGRPVVTAAEGVSEAEAQIRRLSSLGVDLNALGEQLQSEGVAAFAKSYEDLLGAIKARRQNVGGDSGVRCTLALGAFRPAVEERLRRWEGARFLSRLWQKDPTLWFPDPTPEIADRLGWLDLPEAMEKEVEGLNKFAREALDDGISHVVLLGMGGSSLAPEVFGKTFGPAPGHPELVVLDSTHPEAIREVEGRIVPEKTLFIVSSKSGTTLETLSLFRYFWESAGRASASPGRHFVAITDPGSPLETLAAERGFRRVFLAAPDVGGRYSALSVFGLVPASLLGVDLRAILRGARREARDSSPRAAETSCAALALGAALGELALRGRDKATFITSPALEALPAWAEQLVAESTGKAGKGVVPVAGEPLAAPAAYRDDRFFVYVELQGDTGPETEAGLGRLEAAGHPVARITLIRREDLGGAFFLLETAVAAAGAVLGIHPFDQPDVQLAKEFAKTAMETGPGGAGEGAETTSAADRESLKGAIGAWLASAGAGDYVGVQAFLAPSPEMRSTLEEIRMAVRERLGLAVTVGYGPRFLHSTGQLHKGGPGSGLFLQVVDVPAEDLPVPGAGFTFGALVRAQALGDFMALKRVRRRSIRVELGKEAEAGLEALLGVLRDG